MLLDGFRWLDEATGWFRLLPIQRHGLPKAIDKVLSVAESVTAGAASQGPVAQSPAVEGAAAGKSAAGVLPPDARHPHRGRADHLRSARATGGKSLTGVEAKLVSILKEHGPVMERGAMEDLCVADGMNRFSFHAFVSWSPVIAQFGHSVYGLLGTEVSPGQVEEPWSPSAAPTGRTAACWTATAVTEDGKVWLRYRLSKAASTYAVITVPAVLKRIVRGRFQFLDRRRPRAIGTLATKDGRAWGLGAFLRKQGAAHRRPHHPDPRPVRNAPPRSLGTNR